MGSCGTQEIESTSEGLIVQYKLKLMWPMGWMGSPRMSAKTLDSGKMLVVGWSYKYANQSQASASWVRNQTYANLTIALSFIYLFSAVTLDNEQQIYK